MAGNSPPLLRLLLCLIFLTSCAMPSPPQTVTRLIYPALPPTLCARAPAPPSLDASDRAWALYKQARDAAGDDCRDKLDAVDALAKSWPPP